MNKNLSDRLNALIPAMIFLILSLLVVGFTCAQPLSTPEKAHTSLDPLWIYLTIFVLTAILGGAIIFVFMLQRRFLNACIQDNQLAVFSKCPAGLPEGTVRALISFIIIAISLYLSVLLFFQVVGETSKFPEVLSSLLGAVVGFYFGSRTGGKVEDETLKSEVKDLKTEIDTTQSEKLLTKIKKGIDMSRAVVEILPEDKRKKYGDVIFKLEKGYETVQSLTTGGSIKDAVTKGQELVNLFGRENPVRDIFSKALGSFGVVLGGSVQALALITTVAGVSVKLMGSAYEKWKKRILNIPITPAVLQLRAVDANTGFTLLLSSPIFKRIFEAELEGNDRTFMSKAAALLGAENVEDFWSNYADRFTSREEFNQGLQEFRRAALDMEIAADTIDEPSLFAQAGGLKSFMQSVDRINTHEEAKASLHQLSMIVEELQKKGEPVPTIFEKVQKEEGL